MNYFPYKDDLFSWNVRDKPGVLQYYITNKLRISNRMFKYKNLPEHIDVNVFEWYLQTNGFMGAFKDNGKLYFLICSFGGEPNESYIPTKLLVSNPYLKLNKEFTIDKDCVLIKNDSMLQGVLPTYKRYSYLQCENDITLTIASINTRLSTLLSADEDSSFESAKKYLQDIEEGKLGVIAENTFLTDGIKVQPASSGADSNIYTQLCEYDRYLQNSFSREIGLGATANLKRENISENESQQDEDTLLPLVDDMLMCRQESIKKINEMFGTNIEVSLNSSWEIRRDNIEEKKDNEEHKKEGKEEEHEEDN